MEQLELVTKNKEFFLSCKFLKAIGHIIKAL